MPNLYSTTIEVDGFERFNEHLGEMETEGQLCSVERSILTHAVIKAAKKPEVLIEVGTWLGGGSTLHLLRAMGINGVGHLWGIEANSGIYEQMIANIKGAVPDLIDRFTPLFGFSQEVIPQWLAELPQGSPIDFAFLDGGDNPMEQITEFRLLNSRIPVGGQLFSHDAKLRKGKWLVPYLSLLDNWKTQLHDVSPEGLFEAVKIGENPSPESLQRANCALFRMRAHPVELIGQLLPSGICKWILGLLPRKLVLSITQGRH